MVAKSIRTVQLKFFNVILKHKIIKSKKETLNQNLNYGFTNTVACGDL